MSKKFLVIYGQFSESRRCESYYFTQGRKRVCIHTGHIYYPIWVEISIQSSAHNPVEYLWLLWKSA
jgi:hypothetical protein